MKFRPRLSAVLLTVNLTVILLPLGSIFFFRIYENQLIQETERELISQGAIIAASYTTLVAQEPLVPSGDTDHTEGEAPAPATFANGASVWTPITPQLDLAKVDTLPARPDGIAPETPSTQLSVSAGRALTPVLEQAQLTTLAGVRVLDASGTTIGGTAEIGLNFSHIEEVATALRGRYASALRFRELENAPTEFSSLATISRGTKVRVFVAFPIMDKGQVLGAVYLSRTPKSVLRHMYDERDKAMLALLTVIVLAVSLAVLTSRTISRPMAQLLVRTGRVARGETPTLSPLKRTGTREMAELHEGIRKMAEALVDRAAYIRTLASHVSHEFKTPLASIQGAAELLQDHNDDMTPEERLRFLHNISEDGKRLKLLLDRLLDLARAENEVRTGVLVPIRPVAEKVASSVGTNLEVEIEIPATLEARISEDALAIILGNLIENASQHGASKVTVRGADSDNLVILAVADNGHGISEANRAKVFEHFFTTRRDEGGTGLGLGIVQALLTAHGGQIELLQDDPGAHFKVVLPR